MVATRDRIFEDQKDDFREHRLKIRVVTSMDFEPCFKVHNVDG